MPAGELTPAGESMTLPAPYPTAPVSGNETPKASSNNSAAASAPERTERRQEPVSDRPPPEPARDTRAEVAAPVASASAPVSSSPATGVGEQKTGTSRPKEQTEAGWISIPNSGKIPADPSEGAAGYSGDTDISRGKEMATSGGDPRAHASREVAFEPEPTQASSAGRRAIDSSAGEARAGAGAAGKSEPRPASHFERVEATEHIVERGENYWTISRQYWGSGRYYRALWKANEAKHPDIEVLHIGDVIIVPAVEDLDPDYILPASTRTRSVSLTGAGPSQRRANVASGGAGEGLGSSRKPDFGSPAFCRRTATGATGVPSPFG